MASVSRRAAHARARGPARRRRRRIGRGSARGRSRARRLDGPGGGRDSRRARASSSARTPTCACSSTVSDTHSIVERVAARELELGIVGAARRHRGVRFEPFFSDQVILACPPGHAFAGRTITLDELRERHADPHAGGSGRAAGRRGCAPATGRQAPRPRREARARPAGVGPPGGRGRIRRDVHLADRGRGGPRGGAARGGARRGPGRDARDLAGVRHRTRANTGRATRSSRSRESSSRRDRPLGARGAGAAARRARPRATAPRHEPAARRRSSFPVRSASPGFGATRRSTSSRPRPRRPGGADGLVAAGGGSAIDTERRSRQRPAAARRRPDDVLRLRVDAVLRHARRGGAREGGWVGGAHTVAVVYEPALTLDLPRGGDRGDRDERARALRGGAVRQGRTRMRRPAPSCIARWLPVVVEDGRALGPRTELLEGAMHAGMALASRGMFLAHAMAQALGGRYGASHGALNALCLAPALRFNAEVVPDAISRARESHEDRRCSEPRRGACAARGIRAAARSRHSRRASSPTSRCRCRSVPPRASNPRLASAGEIEALLRSIW